MGLNAHCLIKFVCRPQIKIPEVEYYQKVSSDAQISPQGAEKQPSKVNVGDGGSWVDILSLFKGISRKDKEFWGKMPYFGDILPIFGWF